MNKTFNVFLEDSFVILQENDKKYNIVNFWELNDFHINIFSSEGVEKLELNFELPFNSKSFSFDIPKIWELLELQKTTICFFYKTFLVGFNLKTPAYSNQIYLEVGFSFHKLKYRVELCSEYCGESWTKIKRIGASRPPTKQIIL